MLQSSRPVGWLSAIWLSYRHSFRRPRRCATEAVLLDRRRQPSRVSAEPPPRRLRGQSELRFSESAKHPASTYSRPPRLSKRHSVYIVLAMTSLAAVPFRTKEEIRIARPSRALCEDKKTVPSRKGAAADKRPNGFNGLCVWFLGYSVFF